MDIQQHAGATNDTGDHGSKKTQQKSASNNKALRFVTNYGAPHPKRRRIGAACMTCRKRKTACSGERPACETCKQNKLECAGYTNESTGSTAGHKRAASDGPTGRGTEGTASMKQHRSHQGRDVAPGRAFNQDGAQNSSTQYGPSGAGGHISPPNSGSLHNPTTDGNSEGAQDSLFAGPRNRMPYFRWLGPTAIMPGFKQMVVKVKRSENDAARSSTDGASGGAGLLSPSLNHLHTPAADQRMSSSLYSSTPAAVESDIRTPLSLPFYDTSPMPPSELITHLANTFFTHLGCNYPFLQRDRFMRDLDGKQVDAILVDAVCALAARFSSHSLIKQHHEDEGKGAADQGHVFAQRAKVALVDTFGCPSVSAVQAALLLAYNEFGESRDSGLWMYLGIAIRMAQDLGMQNVEGLRFKGKHGPTPKLIKRESTSAESLLAKPSDRPRNGNTRHPVEATVEGKAEAESAKDVEEHKAVEQERVDTFWALFFLDRVVASGTGRRSTLRDKDIELSFPSLDEKDPKTGWPAPFPALIRIVHLYGRVADLLNSIKEPSDITPETPKRLAAMESQVTNFYQGLSARLHFDAVNFQHYMKAGEGTNFVLLHFWFHTMIVLLHQPTLLKTFEGRMLQLFPNSQQLSMSSAKTIADILSYSQLMDAKASLGNPFTTQPIYIAGCAFLKETAEQTASSNAQSRTTSPPRNSSDRSRPSSDNDSSRGKRASMSEHSTADSDPTPKANRMASPEQQRSGGADRFCGAQRSATALAKHTLLATAATQHYQLCYKALQSLENYWSGTKYILTVLDQKFEGVGDPLLYTAEEGESALERPRPEPAFTSPGWRRKHDLGPNYLPGHIVGNAMSGGLPDDFWPAQGLSSGITSPKVDPSKAIGWSLTGQMNSPSTSLAWHYPSATGSNPLYQHTGPTTSSQPNLIPPTPLDYDPQHPPNLTYQPSPRHLRAESSSSHPHAHQRPALPSYPTANSVASQPANPETTAADLLLGLHHNGNNNNNHPHTYAHHHHHPSPTFPSYPTDPDLALFPPYHQPPQHTITPAGANTWLANNPTSTPTAPQDHNHNHNHSHHPPTDPSTANNPTSTPSSNLLLQPSPFTDLLIESQDVDMSLLGLDMMPWFDASGFPDASATGAGAGEAVAGAGAGGGLGVGVGARAGGAAGEGGVLEGGALK